MKPYLLSLIVILLLSSIISCKAFEDKRAKYTDDLLDNMLMAVDLYYEFNGEWPGELKELIDEGLIPKDIGEDIFLDGWKNRIVYKVEPEQKRVILTSYGSDGVAGGKGSAKDIVRDKVYEW